MAHEADLKEPLVSWPNLFAFLGAIGGIGGVFAAVYAGKAYYGQLEIAQQQEATRAAEISRSTYSLDFLSDGSLVMKASSQAQTPQMVVMTPEFDMPGLVSIDELLGEKLERSYLVPDPSFDGITFVLRDVYKQLCHKIGNQDRCEEFGIDRIRVQYIFDSADESMTNYVGVPKQAS